MPLKVGSIFLLKDREKEVAVFICKHRTAKSEVSKVLGSYFLASKWNIWWYASVLSSSKWEQCLWLGTILFWKCWHLWMWRPMNTICKMIIASEVSISIEKQWLIDKECCPELLHLKNVTFHFHNNGSSIYHNAYRFWYLNNNCLSRL
jgi:hypothetical protein